MQYSPLKPNGKGIRAGLILAVSAMLGLVEASSASTCSIGTSDISGNIITPGDVTLGNMNADSCGTGDPFGANPDSVANTPISSPQQLPDDYMDWDVNLNSDGGRNDWQFFYKRDLEPGGSTPADFSLGAGGIDLQITSHSGGDDGFQTGTFTVNASDPILIVLGDGAAFEYTWYLFEGKTGPQSGTWDTTSVFGGNDLSNLTAYVVPVPAAVWLFGSGLLGLVGIARRNKAA